MSASASRRGIPLVLTVVASLLPLRSAGADEAPASYRLETTLLLVGDGGAPKPGEPVLAALSREASRVPEATTVVFLGDNVYPKGIPPEGDRERAEAERRLHAQVESVRSSGARGVFVPGNHDWALGSSTGWDAVKRQEALVASFGAPSVSVLPGGGCPGPAVLDLSPHLRLVVVDTQWWLHPGPKPRHPASPCACDSQEEVAAALKKALQGAGGRHVVVASHHPLESGGSHGGRFSWKDHLFPVVKSGRRVWIPIPVFGSAYVIYRQKGTRTDDMASKPYSGMIDALLSAMEGTPRPLAWAAGHDHSLQVIDGDASAGPRWHLGSGGGYTGGETPVRSLPATRYARSTPGLLRVRVFASGRVDVAAIAVAGPSATDDFTAVLAAGPAGP